MTGAILLKKSLLQQEFYNEFINSLIRTLKSKYPYLDFYASLDSGMDLDRIDLSGFNAMDYHIWFAHTNKIPGLKEVSTIDQTLDYRRVYADLLSSWNSNKKTLVEWMDGRLEFKGIWEDIKWHREITSRIKA